MMRIFVSLALVLAVVDADLYLREPSVIDLTSGTFSDKVLKSDDIWVVEFYAPWCGHCKALTPEYVKAAKALKGVAKVGAVNMDGPDQSVGAPYGVKGFPTIKVFGGDKKNPTDFNGGRDAASIAQAAVQAAAELVQTRLGGGGGGAGGAGGAGGPSKVVTLTDSNFKSKVLESKDPWLVAFVAPWCGHCKNLHPQWESAAAELDGQPVHVGRVDATAAQGIAQQYGVQGYPTIKLFKDGTQEDYQGGRTSSDIVTYLQTVVEANLPPPEVLEITTPKVFEECTAKTFCVLAVLPGLANENAEARNSKLEIMKQLTEKSASYKKFGFLWTEAGKQSDLERVFGVGDYPAVIVVKGNKMKFSTLRGSFSVADMHASIPPRTGGDFEKMPEIKEVEAWDGKDEEVAEEEDGFSLDDIMNESLDDKDEA